ncbi:MAG TPA: class I SAM-dependent methyltransferase [Terriglobales bacterium]
MPPLLHYCGLCQQVGSVQMLHRVYKRGFAVLRCRECELVFTAVFPLRGSHHAIEPSVDRPEGRGYWTREATAREEALFEFYRREARALLQALPIRSGRLLDIGCSFGVLVEEARRAGFDASGLEADLGAAEFARSKFGVEVFSGRLDQAVFPPGSFDVVVLNDVIEHILDPIPFVTEVRRLLRPGGILLLETPNHRSVHALLFGVANKLNNCLRALSGGAFDHPWPGYYDFDPTQVVQAGHVLHFTPRTLQRLLERCGFTNACCHGQYSDTRYLLQRLPSRLCLGAAVVVVVQATARLTRSPNKIVAVATGS